jgi:hypothetical protein
LTAGSAAGLCLLLLGRVGEEIWSNRHSNNPFAKSGPEIVEQLQPFFLVNSSVGLPLIALGFFFFSSFAHWILAIGKRRRARQAVGLLGKENA